MRPTRLAALPCLLLLCLLLPFSQPGGLRAEPAAGAGSEAGGASEGVLDRARARVLSVTGQQLDLVGQEVERADEARAEAARARDERLQRQAQIQADLIDLATAVRTAETTLSDLESQEAELLARSATMERRLASRQSRLEAVLAALQSLALMPQAALVARPRSPHEAVQSAILLRAALPAIEAEGQELRRDLQEMKTLREALQGRRRSAETSRQDLDARRKRLEVALAERRRLLQEAEQDLERLEAVRQELAEEQALVRATLERLGQAPPRPLPPPARPRAEPGQDAPRALPVVTAALAPTPGPSPALVAPEAGEGAFALAEPSDQGLLLPIGGTIAQRFGDPEAPEQFRQGLVLIGRAQATVTAPRSGRIVGIHQQPGSEFGTMLIIQHADAYHTVLSGLGRVTVETGQDVLAGEPLAELPDSPTGKARLYFEYRQKDPVDPFPLLANTPT